MYKSLICKAFVEPWHRMPLFYSTKSNIREIVVAQLGLDHNTINDILQDKHDGNNELSEERITQNCKILKKQTVKLQNINSLIECLRLEPKILLNRILLLEEMGVTTVTLNYIVSFPASMRKSVKVFKMRHNIAPEVDVVRNMFNSVGKSELPNMSKLKGHLRVADCYLQSIAYYKTFHLKLSYKSLLRSQLFKYQSFRQLTELIDLLQTKFQIGKEFLKKYPFLLNLNPDDVKNFLNEFKDVEIAGQNIVTVIRKYPRILQANVSNIKELSALCDEYNVQKTAVYSNLQILAMKRDIFIERYNRMANHPEVDVWLKHSRMLYLLIAHKLVTDRIDVLQVMNRLNSASFHTIYSSRNYFYRSFTQTKYPRVARKRYLKYIFKEEFGEDTEKLIPLITRHPHWRDIPFSTMYKMILYLKQNYTKEDILSNIHLILYPLPIVEKMLEVVNEKYSPENKFAYTNSQRLALCLYMLEKTYHFSGDAVWKVLYVDKDQNETDTKNLEECINNANIIDKKFNPYLK